MAKVVVPKLRGEASTIRLLDPPPEDEAEVDAILEATERGADALEKDPLIALDGVPPDLREAERSRGPTGPRSAACVSVAGRATLGLPGCPRSRSRTF